MPSLDAHAQEADRLLAEAHALIRRAAALQPKHATAINAAAARISQIRNEIANPYRLVG
jgi:hypothetical protein